MSKELIEKMRADALEAKAAPVGEVKKFWADLCVHHIEAVRYSDYAALEAELAKLRAELERRAVDGWKLVPVEPTPEMVSAAEEAHMPFGDMDIALRMAILSAPSAHKADDPVKVQLLEALTDSLELMETLCAFEGDTIRKARAAIAAARKGEGE